MRTGDRRVVLLTGAGGLLGNEFCRRYAATHDIVAVCRTRGPGVPTQHESYVDPLDPGQEPEANASRVFTVFGDLTQSGQIERVIEVALARFGRIDLLVNNAAHLQQNPHGMIDGDGALLDLDRHLTTNVSVPARMAIRVAQEFWRDRADENRAAKRSVVNISSVSASRVYPHQGQGMYAASKAALNQLTRHMATEFEAFGVRVNALSPNSFPAIVKTEDVADAIIRLDQDTVTGRVLVLDEDTTGTASSS